MKTIQVIMMLEWCQCQCHTWHTIQCDCRLAVLEYDWSTNASNQEEWQDKTCPIIHVKRFMNVEVVGVNSSTTHCGQPDLMYSRMYIINTNLTAKLVKWKVKERLTMMMMEMEMEMGIKIKNRSGLWISWMLSILIDYQLQSRVSTHYRRIHIPKYLSGRMRILWQRLWY